MKLSKLKLKNLNSFREEIELDFEKSPLDEAGLVAITGPTGAGKTTLLDAICLALYGKTPRLHGSDTKSPKHLIPHGEKEGYAEVLFVANGKRYLAEWNLRRGSSPKGRLLELEQNRLITDKLSTKGKSLGTSEKTVSEKVEEILGINFDTFKRSVMLAQGEFAAFLKETNEKRREILEVTAGIGIYDDLKKALNDKIKIVREKHQKVLGKLDTVPEASCEQLAQAETTLAGLQDNARALADERERCREEKERESVRAEAFEKLRSSKARTDELLSQKHEMAKREAERAQAIRANNLRLEKYEFDDATAKLRDEDALLRKAEAERDAAKIQFQQNKTNFIQIDNTYNTVLAEKQAKMTDYTDAKYNVKQAQDRAKQEENLIPELEKLAAQMKALSKQLTENEDRQVELHQQIHAAEKFLCENPLPVDRQSRLTEAKERLVAYHQLQEKHEEKSEQKAKDSSKFESLEDKLAQLSRRCKKITAEEETARVNLITAEERVVSLEETGNLEKWRNEKEQAQRALPIIQESEAVHRQLTDVAHNKADLQKSLATLSNKLEKVKRQRDAQIDICERAAGEVNRTENAKELALLVAPINQLRQQLETGKPCSVCGATEHPCADEVEQEGDEKLEVAEKALAQAKIDSQRVQKKMQQLETKKTRLEQDKLNLTSQVQEAEQKIDALTQKTETLARKSHKIYPQITTISVETQISELETAIDELKSAQNLFKEASYDYATVSEKLVNCEKEIARETELFKETEQNLQNLTGELEDVAVDLSNSKARFWELMPNTFHHPEKAIAQFESQIKAVETKEQERAEKGQELKQLELKISSNEGDLERVKKEYKEVHNDIKRYQSEKNSFFADARDKTDGLTTENEIDTAIEKLEKVVEIKANQREEAERHFEDNKTEFTRSQAAHAHRISGHAESKKNVEKARKTYLDALNRAGFDSPQTHEAAFREEAWVQKVEKEITAYNQEKHRLELEITEWESRFEETPFEPHQLPQITAQIQEIEKAIPPAQEKIGAQRQKITDLNNALSKRKALADEMQGTGQELTRWDTLQESITSNSLRDFAIDIMFKQVARIANVQLNFLTSERYQFKVETIGELTIIDKWNANEERPVETLSGGESFLTSLALALALSELSRGRAQLSSFFLDEGFGTLDAETLDITLAALEGLQMQGRSIFLTSHVQELTRRLPVKINVRKRGNGFSYIQISP